MNKPSIPLMAGFECSSHRRSDGVRVDILRQTGHVENALEDYRLMHSIGIQTVREGLQWHKIEMVRGQRDWSSFELLRDAAALTATEIIWDLLHFGFPDWVNPFHPDFPEIFADLAADFASRNGPGGIYVPINEISFLAWAAGDVEYMYPYSRGRGPELKRALCAASIAAINAIREVDERAIIVAVDPMIAVQPDPSLGDGKAAEEFHNAQFEALDILTGRAVPELGGHPALIDIVGLNHYPQSQWTIGQDAIDWQSDRWVSPAKLLKNFYTKYEKPILLAETGCEGENRARWFEHILTECQKAVAADVPIVGLCLYPILSHQAWTGERYCPNGLFDGTDERRFPHKPLLSSIWRYQDPNNSTTQLPGRH